MAGGATGIVGDDVPGLGAVGGDVGGVIEAGAVGRD